MKKKMFERFNIKKSSNKSLLCCYLSAISYQSKKVQYKWLIENFRMKDFDSNEINYVNFFTVVDDTDNTFYVVFRGTHMNSFKYRMKNLLISLNFNLVYDKEKNCKIHNGYKKCGKTMYDALFFKIKEKYDEGYNLVFTGHSLGGAVAQYVASNIDIDCDVYTFGAPRVAEDYFFHSSDSNISYYEYITKNDMICDFPSAIISFREYIEINYDGSIEKKIKSNRCWISTVIYLLEIKLVMRITQLSRVHGMNHYLKLMTKCFKNNE